jgi:hypothetical protein
MTVYVASAFEDPERMAVAIVLEITGKDAQFF